MKFQAVKGTRDFYPDAMRLRNWITEAWRRVALRNGFEEYDAPIFEYLDLFTVKSGQEIAEQLFSLTDRGGRHLAIRPEITPSLARMVNEKIHTLPRPIKWFSIPRVCRAEKPQRGRLREFFQWNVDIIGTDDLLADAECIFVAVDFLRDIGLRPEDVVVRIGSRALTATALGAVGVDGPAVETVLPVLDKRPKVSAEEFARLCGTVGLTDKQVHGITRFQDAPDVAAMREVLAELAAPEDACRAQVGELEALLAALETMGASDYCVLDMRIVRGLAYYTGIVYEIYDAAESLRAVAGGGRYDNLLEVLGGPKVTGTGFGMGDVVLGILLEDKGRVPEAVQAPRLDFFVIDGEERAFNDVIALVGALRAKGFWADFSFKRQPVGKQLKAANRRGAARAVIVHPGGTVVVKDMATGRQQERARDDFLGSPLT